jgi:hypothetical protein
MFHGITNRGQGWLKVLTATPVPITHLPAYVNSYSYTYKVSSLKEVPTWRLMQEHGDMQVEEIAKASAAITKQLEANAPLPHALGCGCGPCYW